MNRALTFLAASAESLLRERSRILLAIDGRCASGKTTLAAAFQKRIPCTVIHMDDFFLRPEQRTPERLAEPGGNVDRERFLQEVLLPLKQGRRFSFRPFRCITQTPGGPVFVEPGAITLVEGSYCCHPLLSLHYDLRIFLTVDPEVQAQRLLRRDPEKAADFQTRWIPMEERYFAAFDIPGRCHAEFDTSRDFI